MIKVNKQMYRSIFKVALEILNDYIFRELILKFEKFRWKKYGDSSLSRSNMCSYIIPKNAYGSNSLLQISTGAQFAQR